MWSFLFIKQESVSGEINEFIDNKIYVLHNCNFCVCRLIVEGSNVGGLGCQANINVP